jgi:hypothetical protein
METQKNKHILFYSILLYSDNRYSKISINSFSYSAYMHRKYYIYNVNMLNNFRTLAFVHFDVKI